MKNNLVRFILLFLATGAFAQQSQTGSPPATNTASRAEAAWYRGGNNAVPDTNNVFGTRWNSPIYTITSGRNRMKLNGQYTAGTQYPINSFGAAQGVNTSGYLLVGPNSTVTPTAGDTIYGRRMGAFSLLHLNGGHGSVWERPYRPWMQTGITLTDHGDLAYMGMKRVNHMDPSEQKIEMLIAWGNDNALPFGPDDMVFRFLGSTNSTSTTPGSNSLSDDIDGFHVARFTPLGQLCIGPDFSTSFRPLANHRLDVQGNARFRNVPTNPSEYLLLGKKVTSDPNDIEFSKTAFPNNPNMFLDGTGAWQTLPTVGAGTVLGAHNGASLSTLDPTRVSLGSNLGTTTGQLLSPREIPMNGHYVVFTNGGDGTGAPLGLVNRVGVGTNGVPGGKLHVNVGTGEDVGVAQMVTSQQIGLVGGTNIYGAYTIVNGNQSVGGVNHFASRTVVSGATGANQAAWLSATGGNEAIGVTIDASGGNNNLGLQAVASGVANSCIGVSGIANGGTSQNYGVYGAAAPGPVSFAGYFSGDVYVTGTVTEGSDRRLKDNIKPLGDVTEKLQRLTGYTYQFRTEEFKGRNLSKGEQLGLIAQEVQAEFPQLVRADADGYLGVNYDGMVPVLVEAIKAQQKEIDELKSMVVALTASTAAGNVRVVELSNVTAPELGQNAPNPFDEHTVISYSVPSDAQHAEIVVHDALGRMIQTVVITERGQGSLHALGAKLAAGSYTYSLVVDGKVVATKLMVKQ